MVLKPALLAMRDKMDLGSYGGVPLLGVNGVVMIAHGGRTHARSERVRRGERGCVFGHVSAIRSLARK
jgi:fatty acid/phospholipid biosynthesis enzyme